MMHITVWEVYAKSHKVSKLFQCNDLFSSTLHYIRKTKQKWFCSKMSLFILKFLT